jgi:hypothetical protein
MQFLYLICLSYLIKISQMLKCSTKNRRSLMEEYSLFMIKVQKFFLKIHTSKQLKSFNKHQILIVLRIQVTIIEKYTEKNQMSISLEKSMLMKMI